MGAGGYGWSWTAVDGSLVVVDKCGWVPMGVNGRGWVWAVVDGCGQLWAAVDGCGRARMGHWCWRTGVDERGRASTSVDECGRAWVGEDGLVPQFWRSGGGATASECLWGLPSAATSRHRPPIAHRGRRTGQRGGVSGGCEIGASCGGRARPAVKIKLRCSPWSGDHGGALREALVDGCGVGGWGWVGIAILASQRQHSCPWMDMGAARGCHITYLPTDYASEALNGCGRVWTGVDGRWWAGRDGRWRRQWSVVCSQKTARMPPPVVRTPRGSEARGAGGD